MDKWQKDVLEFHETFGVRVRDKPDALDDETRELRVCLIREEVDELLRALETGGLVDIAKESADVIVVVLGTCVSCGIDLEPVWDEVHRSNMTKVGGPRRKDGKVLKPEDWQSPRILEVLSAQNKRV